MTLLERDFDSMTPGQRVMWFATCGCNAEEIAEWLAVPSCEVQALFLREAYRYEPLKRPA
jgi:hypothetical protein